MTEGHHRDTFRDLRRELPFRIKSFLFRDAPVLVKAHGRPPPSSAGSLGCIHPHLPSAWFCFPLSASLILPTLVALVVAFGKKRAQVYTSDLTSPLAVVLLHKQMLQPCAEMFSHATSPQPSRIPQEVLFPAETLLHRPS